jgi:transposase
VITSVKRRRWWSLVEKERIVAAALEPGAVASEIARSADIHASQLFRWRQQLCGPAQDASTFIPVSVVPVPAPPTSATHPAVTEASPVSRMIEIEFAAGSRMRLTGAIEPSTLSALIAALAQQPRR